jgi:DNA processing protein
MPLGWQPRARDFPRRNRIIAGIGLGLIVVEAAHRSGSLISARNAGELGRMVFAVPGSPLDPRAAGTNALIRDGAILAGKADDILQALAPMAGDPARPATVEPLLPNDDTIPPQALQTTGQQHARVAGALGPAPTALDDLVRHSGLTPADAVLLELDLAGRLAHHPDGCVSLLPERSR